MKNRTPSIRDIRVRIQRGGGLVFEPLKRIAQAKRRRELMENTPIGTVTGWHKQLGGKWRDVVAEITSHDNVIRHTIFDSRAHCDEPSPLIVFHQVRDQRRRLRIGLRASSPVIFRANAAYRIWPEPFVTFPKMQ